MNVPITEIVKQFNANTWYVLECIQRNPDISHLGIRNELNLSQGKVDKEICRLEGALFILTKRNDLDQRLLVYKLTTYGEYALNIK